MNTITNTIPVTVKVEGVENDFCSTECDFFVKGSGRSFHGKLPHKCGLTNETIRVNIVAHIEEQKNGGDGEFRCCRTEYCIETFRIISPLEQAVLDIKKLVSDTIKN